MKKENTTLIKNFLKESIEKKLIEKFSLHKVDPIYVVNSNYSLKPHRMINFDNAISGEIFSLTNQMNFSLLRYMQDLEIPLNAGFICYYCKFNRDYPKDNINTHSEFHFIIEYRIKVQDANKDYMSNISKTIFNEINDCINECNIKYNLLKPLPKKLLVSSLDSIWKKYPTLKIKDALNQEIANHGLCLFFDINGTNKRSINLLNDDDVIFKNKIFGNFYIYLAENQVSTPIGSIYICPTKDDINNFIKENDLNDNYDNLIKVLPSDDNYLIINLNLSRLLMYIFNKSNINEIV